MSRMLHLTGALLLALTLAAPAARAGEKLTAEQIKAREAAALKKAMAPAKSATTPAALKESPVPETPTYAEVWERHTKEGVPEEEKLDLWNTFLVVTKKQMALGKSKVKLLKAALGKRLLDESKEIAADESKPWATRLTEIEKRGNILGRGKAAKQIGKVYKQAKKAYVKDLWAKATAKAADEKASDDDVIASYQAIIEVAGVKSRDAKKAKKLIARVSERLVLAPYEQAVILHKDRKAAVAAKITAWQKVSEVGKGTKYGKKADKYIAALRTKDLKARFKGAAKADKSKKTTIEAKVAAWKAVLEAAEQVTAKKAKKYKRKATARLAYWEKKLPKKPADPKPEPVKPAEGPKTVVVEDEAKPVKPAKSTQPEVKPASAPATSPALAAGTKAPPFTLRTLNADASGMKLVNLGRHVGERADPAKKAVLLSFFADYCQPCKKEMPTLEALNAEFKDKGLLVVAVCIDKKNEDLEKVKAFLAEKKLTIPVVSDKMNIVARRYQVERLPAVYFIGPDGKVSSSKFGYEESGGEAYLRNQITKMLGGGAAKTTPVKKVEPVKKKATVDDDDDEDEDEDEDE